MAKKLPQLNHFSQAKESINHLSENDLMLLNQMVIERLKYIQKSNSLKAMSNFSIGDRICFERNNELIAGFIRKLNQKTISIETDEGIGWNVAPSLLKRYIQIDD